MPRPILFPWLFLSALLLAFLPVNSSAQSPREACVEVSAIAATTEPRITLQWPAVSYATGSLSIWRRVKGSSNWGTATTLSSTATSYADMTAEAGIAYEYSLQCPRSVNPKTAYGGIVAASNLPLVENRGKVILLVDSTQATVLAPELNQLQRNLVADGWTLYRHDIARQAVPASSTNSADYANRLAEVQAVRSLIRADYNTAPGTDWALFLFGRIPVPYSGQIAPDGHVDHFGAWPTDTYYADVDGTWADSSVNTTSPAETRNWNVPGDGKFDAAVIPSNVELQCGRVDLANLSNVPTGLTETQLLRQYLVRDHLFRRAQAPYHAVPDKMLIDDNFWYLGGEAFASSGWRAAFSLLGRSSSAIVEGDWFGNLQTTPMLMTYGCGSGSYLSIGGIGRSQTDFQRKDSQSVINMTFGSYFGDWDNLTDNILRAPLAGTANSLGLANMWSGRGYFHLYHLGLGEALGYSTRYTQNHAESTSSGGWAVNSFLRYITYNLMGDPTLRLHNIAPPAKVTTISTTGGNTLNWIASPTVGVTGYHVYRANSANGPFTRLTGTAATGSNPTGSPLNAYTYTDTDSSLVAGTDYTYLVKAVKLETTPSGTYANQSLGDALTLTHLPANAVPLVPTRLTVTRSGTTTCVLTWDDNATDETAYRVERRDPTTGIWSQIQSLAANVTTATDSASPAGKPVHYRVCAVSSQATSAYSNEAADYTLPGLAYGNAWTVNVSRATANATFSLTRYNGAAGNATLTYTTSDFLSNAGTDYTATTGTVSWAHGESGSKGGSIPLLNPSGQNLTRILKVTYGNPTNGLALNNPPASYIYLYNPAALTLPGNWLTTTFGTVISGEEGYAEHDNGTFGLAVHSDAANIWGGTTTDSARFLYQPITGDCQITARLKYMTGTLAANLIGGVMIRSSLNADAPTDSLMQYQGYTTPFRATRTSASGSLNTSLISSTVVWQPFKNPVWMRLTRSGTTIAIATSPDGLTWTEAKSDVTLSALGTTAYVGLYLASGNTTFPGGPQAYAQFDNVTLYSVPDAVTTLTASTATATQSGQIALAWSPVSTATIYLIERATSAGGSYSQIGQTSATSLLDAGLAAGQTYFYRVKASNPVYTAASYSPVFSTTPYIPATVNGWRYTYFGTEQSSGPADDFADPDNDGLPNLIEYALGLSPLVANTPANQPHTQIQTVDNNTTLTFTFTRNTAATDTQFILETASSLAGTWSQLDPLLAGNQVSVQDNTPTAGIQTITVKDTQPISNSNQRYLRLRITRP